MRGSKWYTLRCAKINSPMPRIRLRRPSVAAAEVAPAVVAVVGVVDPRNKEWKRSTWAAAEVNMELIRVENIHKTYHLGEIDVPVLNGVSFTIHRGEMVALMGASGSGKTTLMNILGCLDHPSAGKYWLDGEELSELK